MRATPAQRRTAQQQLIFGDGSARNADRHDARPRDRPGIRGWRERPFLRGEKRRCARGKAQVPDGQRAGARAPAFRHRHARPEVALLGHGNTAHARDTRSMNVLLVVPWDQAYGGVASVVGNLARHLQDTGHGVAFLHPGPTERMRERATASGFNGYEIELRAPVIEESSLKSVAAFAAHLVPTLWRLASLIRKRGIQVVNIHYPTEAFV